jgi:sulfonate transport system substrate-binding protein
MKTIRIGGVPEHYNLPFYQANQEQPFIDAGYKLEFSIYSTGTGAMLNDLKDSYLDMAILLTEGIITDQHAGNTANIVAHYVKSPLIWGVHKHVANPFQLKNGVTSDTKFAISRLKSGSHLMAYLYAQKFGVALDDEQFEIVNNMNGAAAALEINQADLFLWEKFTTKPLVDQGVFERVDVCPTLWEPFVVVANPDISAEHASFITLLIEWLQKRTQSLKSNAESTVGEISDRFHLKKEDAAEWLKNVEWDVKPVHSKSEFEHVEQILIDLNIIQPDHIAV